MIQTAIMITLTPHNPENPKKIPPIQIPIDRIHQISSSPLPPEGPIPTFRVITTVLEHVLPTAQNQETGHVSYQIPTSSMAVKETQAEIQKLIQKAVKERMVLFKSGMDSESWKTPEDDSAEEESS